MKLVEENLNMLTKRPSSRRDLVRTTIPSTVTIRPSKIRQRPRPLQPGVAMPPPVNWTRQRTRSRRYEQGCRSPERARRARAPQRGLRDGFQLLQAIQNGGCECQQGVIDILTGNYEQAIRNFKDADGCNFNLALSYLLTGQLNQAENIDCDRDRDCARCSYLKAIIAARKGNTDDVKKYLDEVADKDKALAERAYTDIEFAEYYK